MSYFPIYYSIENKKVLLVGAGFVASEKLGKLLDFTNNVTIIASDFKDEVLEQARKNDLKIIKRDYKVGDVKSFDIVVAAVDNLKIQESIYFECKKENIMCNCVDIQKYCDFIFPSYIKKGDLTISISTSGSSPAMAKNIRVYLEKLIPDSIVDFLQQMKRYREEMPKGKERMQFLDKKAKDYIKTWK